MTVDPEPSRVDVAPSDGDDDAPDRAAVAVPAPGTELLGAADEDDERFLARRGDGQLVRMPQTLYRVAELLDGRRDLAAVAARIGAQEDRVCSVEEVRLVIERRLVPAGLVLPLPDTDAAVGAHPDTDAGFDARPETGGGRARRRRGARVVALVLAGLVLVAATAAVTTLVVRPDPAPPSPPVVEAADSTSGGTPPGTAPGGLTGPPTLFGRVVEVPDVATAVVDVAGRRLRVDVAGLAPGGTPSCATTDARTFAEQTLQDREVAVVPDPTLPQAPADRWRAYLVLDSQLSYTDAALGAGWATAGESRYRAGYLERQAAAERAGLGQFGPPCRGAG